MNTYDLDLDRQERQREEELSRKRIAQENEDGDIRWIMSSKRGRRVVWRLLEAANTFSDPFNQNTAIMAHNVGMQRYGRWLFGRIRTLCPELDLVMTRENKEKNGGTGEQSH